MKASGVGEIMAAAEFYDFDAKYYNAESKTVVDPELPGMRQKMSAKQQWRSSRQWTATAYPEWISS